MKTNQWYTQFSDLVASVALEYENNEWDREDLIQDIWVRIIEKQDQAPADERALSTWLYTLAHNHCKNYVRDKMSEVRTVSDSLLTPPEPADEEDEPTHGSYIEETVESPYGSAEDLVALDELATDLDQLSPQERVVFKAIYIDGLSLADVAAAGVGNPGEVVSRIKNKAGARRQANKGKSKPVYGGTYADWSWKPKGCGNQRMGSTECRSRPDLVEAYNNNNG